MQFGVVIPSYGPFGDAAKIRELIAAAEHFGYHTAWFGDHIVIPDYAAHVSSPEWFDSLACCIAGAASTERLRFGTDVLVLPYRHPVALSQLLASADQLCGGRLTLGVGVGYIRGEFAALDAPYEHRGAATDEYIDVLRCLWETEGAASYDGRFVQFDNVHAGPAPHQSPFPILVGGNHPAGRRRAARRGDGWHPLFPTPEQYASGRADIEGQRAALGRRDPFVFSYTCPETRVVLDASELRPPISYADLPDIPDDYNYAPPFPHAADGRAHFVGTPDQLFSDIGQYASAGVEHLALRFWTGDPSMDTDDVIEQYRRFAELVAPGLTQ